MCHQYSQCSLNFVDPVSLWPIYDWSWLFVQTQLVIGYLGRVILCLIVIHLEISYLSSMDPSGSIDFFGCYIEKYERMPFFVYPWAILCWGNMNMLQSSISSQKVKPKLSCCNYTQKEGMPSRLSGDNTTTSVWCFLLDSHSLVRGEGFKRWCSQPIWIGLYNVILVVERTHFVINVRI